MNIQTDNEEYVGVQRTIIRDCDAMARLLELNLYIDVQSNTHPDFTSEVQTTFQVKLGDTERYTLPPVTDSD